jgi:hypothetical protein
MSTLSIPVPARRNHGRPEADPTPRRDRRPPLRLVEPETQRRRLRMGVVGLVLFATVCAGIFALAAVHAMVVQAQFELDQLDQRVAERRGDLDGLRLDVARMEAPATITAAARDLGLVTPTGRVYLDPVVTPVPDHGGSTGASSPSAGDEAARPPAGG